jgi:hypothetical protein
MHGGNQQVVRSSLPSNTLEVHPQNSSIIAEMHLQRGMAAIKQDLQKNISRYQNYLKNTYAAAEKDKKPRKSQGSKETKVPKDTQIAKKGSASY